MSQGLCGHHLPCSYWYKQLLSICDFTQRGTPLARLHPTLGVQLSHWSGTGLYNPILEGGLYPGIFIMNSISTFSPLSSFSCVISLWCQLLERKRHFSQALQLCAFYLLEPVKMKCLTPEVHFSSLINKEVALLTTLNSISICLQICVCSSQALGRQAVPVAELCLCLTVGACMWMKRQCFEIFQRCPVVHLEKRGHYWSFSWWTSP